MKNQFGRRDLLRHGGLAGLGLLASSPLLAGANCLVTPKQILGPFYPVAPQVDEDADLTTVEGRTTKSPAIHLHGTVTDAACKPIGGALIEIWQACASGRYRHPRDTNPAALDPDFQYWGRAYTDAKGFYQFRTIKPGAYPASATWWRPPHIHFRVVAKGMAPFVTQMYFAGEKLNDKDKLLMRLPRELQMRLIVAIETAFPGKAASGLFNLTLGGNSHKNATPEIDD